MNTLTILKRTTAIAAVVALPLTPMLAHGESAQVTDVSPPASEQTDTATQAAEGQEQGQQFGETTPTPVDSSEAKATDAEQDSERSADKAADKAAGPEKSAAELQSDQAEAGLTVPGGEGTQSGETADDEELEAETTEGDVLDATTETGAVTEGQEGTQSGEAPDQEPTGDQSGRSDAGQADDQDPATTQGAGDQAARDQQAQTRQAAAGDDALVAKVGEREIRQSDIVAVIGMLPPELQQQPAEMLVPIALDQLVMRELILQEAQEAGLESDPTVEGLGADAPQQAKEDAMVQAWLSDELGRAVTEEKVEETYANLKQQFGDQAPPMEQIRPQIEQELREKAFLDLSQELQEDADVTLYGPDGEPIEE